MASRLNVLVAALLAASFLGLGIHYSGSVSASSSGVLSLYGSLCAVIVRLSHAPSAFNHWLMLCVAGVLVFFRLRRKHHAVFSHAFLSLPRPIDESTAVRRQSVPSAIL